MKSIAAYATEKPVFPACERCGGVTRLIGIEPHSTIERTELRTFVCTQCEAVQVEVVALGPLSV